jgi:predicted ribosome quality control (RQC) complex YloA/Tae2 family protein
MSHIVRYKLLFGIIFGMLTGLALFLVDHKKRSKLMQVKQIEVDRKTKIYEQSINNAIQSIYVEIYVEI